MPQVLGKRILIEETVEANNENDLTLQEYQEISVREQVLSAENMTVKRPTGINISCTICFSDKTETNLIAFVYTCASRSHIDKELIPE